jgi:hypothetical protein
MKENSDYFSKFGPIPVCYSSIGLWTIAFSKVIYYLDWYFIKIIQINSGYNSAFRCKIGDWDKNQPDCK